MLRCAVTSAVTGARYADAVTGARYADAITDAGCADAGCAGYASPFTSRNKIIKFYNFL